MTMKNSLSRVGFELNMNLVFNISEDGSEIELKHCPSSKTSVNSSRKYFVHLIKLDKTRYYLLHRHFTVTRGRKFRDARAVSGLAGR